MRGFFMSQMKLRAAQNGYTDKGKLQINVTSTLGFLPVKDAKVRITFSGEPNTVIEELDTNISGQTVVVELPAPPVDYSFEPGAAQPYADYDITVTAPGYETVLVEGVQVLPDVESYQPVSMEPEEVETAPEEEIVIPPHVLFAEYPPKIEEDEIKEADDDGEIVLSRVVIPETIVVHDGLPNDTRAKNYYVPYRDYIKNVVSSEIYATWPEPTIYANILAIMSFTLNRVYTEWYRNRNYNFTITSSTVYDQKWVYGRNIFSNISYLVDSIFANYLSRPGVKQPIFTSYCNGTTSTCSGLSQWGSKYLGDRGYSAIEILRYYYGNNMYINTASGISGIPSSWPGYNLTNGARGEKVRQVQQQLNRIAQSYPAIPVISADGIFGPRTGEAVKGFQQIFGLPATGIVDYPTWYKISAIYVAVSRISEPGT